MRSAAAGAGPVIRLARSGPWATRDADRVLDAPGRRRRDRLVQRVDRDDFVAARVLAREAVGEVAGCAVGSVVVRQHCDGCGGTDHGRPVVVEPRGLHVSWAHARGLVAVIASHDRVGIDLERVRRLADDVVGHALAPGERAAGGRPTDADVIGRWARKEALVKVGACRLDDFPKVDLGRDADRWGGWILCGRPVAVAGAQAFVAVASEGAALASEGAAGGERDRGSRAALQAALERAVRAFDEPRVPVDA